MKEKHSDISKKRMYGLIILLVISLIAGLSCLCWTEQPAVQLVWIVGIVLSGFCLFFFLANIRKEDLHISRANQILLSVYIGFLIIFSFILFRRIHDSSFLLFTGMIICFVLLVTGICMGILINCESVNSKVVFAVSFLIIGCLFTLTMPVGEVPDEKSHFQTAYQLSNRMLGISAGNKKEIFMRQDDAQFQILEMHVTEKKYTDYLNSASDTLKNDNLISVKSQTLVDNDYLYILPATGITIGRLFHWNSFWTMNLGRICNLIFACILMTIAVNMIPVGKNILFLLCLMPMTMQQNMSYSYDCPANALGMFVIAYSIRKLYEENGHVSVLEKILLIIGISTMFMVKSHAYFLIGLLPIIVWLRNRRKLSQNRRDVLMKRSTWILIGLIVAVLLLFCTHFVGKIIPESHHYLAWADGKEGYTLWYLAIHPERILTVSLGTIRYQAGTYFTTFFGRWMGWIEINTGSICTVLLSVSLVITLLSEKNKLNAKDGRVLCWIISIGTILCIFGGFFLTYTTLISPFIQGVQGRYLILPVTLLLIAIAGKVKKRLDISKSYYLYVVLLCAGITLFRILAFYAGV